MIMEKKFKTQKGDSRLNQDEPIISITGKGHQAYIWIGNDSKTDKKCFATLSGMKTLERFAFTLLKQLGHQPNWLLAEKKIKTNKRRVIV